MGIETVVARALQIILALGGAYLVALWFVMIVWAYRDIEARSRNVLTQILSTLLVVLFWIPGVLLYLILRPKETLDSTYQRSLEEEYLLQDLEELPLCPSCERYVEHDFVLCPHCHTRLREPCLACARLIDLRWSVCAYCGAAQGGEGADKPERVEAPAARWRSSSRQRRQAERPALPDGEAAMPASPGGADREEVASAVDPAASAADELEGISPAPGAAPLREPIPLVPVPRGRFKRSEIDGSARPAANGHRPVPSEPQVSTGGLFTSILGTRNSDPGRAAAGAARARRIARGADPSPSLADKGGNGAGNGAGRFDRSNGASIAADANGISDPDESAARHPLPAAADGNGD